MAGFGGTDVLSQLPADAIDRVEVITSPSARYDAEGTAGILNIILKKEKTLGFNGSLTLTAGYPDNAGISANVNLRTDKYNIFNTTGFRYFDAPGNGYFDTRFNENSQVFFDRIIEDREIERLNRGFNTNLGMDRSLPVFSIDRGKMRTLRQTLLKTILTGAKSIELPGERIKWKRTIAISLR